MRERRKDDHRKQKQQKILNKPEHAKDGESGDNGSDVESKSLGKKPHPAGS